MALLFTFLLRLVVVVAGLVFAASIAFAFVLMLAFWLLRAAWCKLTGRPLMPFVVRFHPRDGFNRMYRRADADSRTPRADSAPAGRNIADITDVEPKAPRG